METTTNLNMPYLAPAQAQKHVTHNEALRRLDAVVHLSVLAMDVGVAPASPNEGDRYHVAQAAQGDWVGRDGQIAAFQDGAWAFLQPRAGWILHDHSASSLYVHDGVTFQPIGGRFGAASAPRFGVNTVADPTNRLAVKSDALLVSHDDVTPGSGDVRIVVNKAAEERVASFLFQDNFGGRAEFGLIGDDQFRCRVSTDGATFHDGFVVDQNAHIGLGVAAPQTRVHIGGGDLRVDGAVGVNSAPSLGNIHVRSAISILAYESPNAAVDEKITRILSTATDFRMDFMNDARTSATKFLSVTRQGTEFDEIRIGGPRLRITNDPAVIRTDNALVVGDPVGGAKGNGAINANNVYDDNALLSCYVFDQALDAAIDRAKWDAKGLVPRQPQSDQPQSGQPQSASRVHTPMRQFAKRLGTAHDPLTLDGYARHWKEKRHLSSMPNEKRFDQRLGLSTGEWIQRLVETVEIQAILIEHLNQRTAHLAR